jgi:hypothetical protein
MPELRTEYSFYIQISIELKFKSARRVLNRFAWFKAQMKENFLSYLVIFCFFVVNPLLFKIIAAFVCLGRSSGIATYKIVFDTQFDGIPS